MAPVWGARRFSLYVNSAPLESPGSSFGEEILPTIDAEALARLPPHERQAFTDMRMRDRVRIVSRWRKDGRPMPQSDASTPNDSATRLIRTSSAPQLPELQMDVSTAMFADPVDKKSSHDAPMPASGAAQEITKERDANGMGSKVHRCLRFTPSMLSIRCRSDQPEQYADETPEKRCLRKLHGDQMVLGNIENERDREWARFRGIGAVPPGYGAASCSPTAADRIHARTITRNHAVIQATGRQPNAYESLDIARAVDNEERALRAAEGSLDLHRPMFVRSGISNSSPATSARTATSSEAYPQRVEPGSSTDTTGLLHGNVYKGDQGSKLNLFNELPEHMNEIHIGPVKKVGQKIEASKQWIKKVFNSKSERKKKARTPGRRASRANLFEEAQVCTATTVRMTPVRAPRPEQALSSHERPPAKLQKPVEQSYLQRTPPRLQASSRLVDVQPRSSAVREGESQGNYRRTTRAAMEGYE